LNGPLQNDYEQLLAHPKMEVIGMVSEMDAPKTWKTELISIPMETLQCSYSDTKTIH